MSDNEEFEAISHPIRIKILKILYEKSLGFSELKRELGIKSSGKLDFHIKKLGKLITTDSKGKYTLTKDGYAAFQAVITIKKYGWQKRAYYINLLIIITVNVYLSFINRSLWLTLVLPTSIVWIIFYSYWSIGRRKYLKGTERIILFNAI